jgi:pimeloyl-ACP methyl ester carboxylesterase
VRKAERVDARYRWRGHDVHYERSGRVDASRHVVLLHGFGVGTFHYESQLAELPSAGEEDACVWALDLVGQGASWPPAGEAAAPGFRYSVETWRDQIEDFLERVVVGDRRKNANEEKKKTTGVYLAGNSLGGYLATYVAASCADEDLVRGVVLLNATPFWAFTSADDAAWAPWKGALPTPGWIRAPLRLYWDSFRSAANVKGLLSLVYDSPARVDDALVENIIAPTNNVNALDAFCSVVWSPKASIDFDEMLRRLREERRGVKIALMYGREDPWVVPLWGRRVKRAAPSATYYEIERCGHCPAHESPGVVNDLIAKYVDWCERGCVGDAPGGSACGAGRLIDGSPRNVFETVDAAVAGWRGGR